MQGDGVVDVGPANEQHVHASVRACRYGTHIRDSLSLFHARLVITRANARVRERACNARYSSVFSSSVAT